MLLRRLSNGSGYGSEGYSEQDKGIDCTINNNNNNTNIVAGADGGNVTELLTCEECFRAFLTTNQISDIRGAGTLESACANLTGTTFSEASFRTALANAGVLPA